MENEQLNQYYNLHKRTNIVEFNDPPSQEELRKRFETAQASIKDRTKKPLQSVLERLKEQD